MAALEQCGWLVEESAEDVVLTPPVTSHPAAEVEIACGNCGTMLRLLVAALCAVPGKFVLDGVSRLRERPIAPLVDAVTQLGGRLEYLGRAGSVPIRVHGESLVGGRARLDARESSQYLSAVLLAALVAPEPTLVEVDSLVSAPYVELTVGAARAFGGQLDGFADPVTGRRSFRVRPSKLHADRVTIEADASAACYGAAAAALCGSSVEICGLPRDSAQGDLGFFDLLEAMGATVARRDRWIIGGSHSLRAIDADLSAMPDQVPTLAALAPFAEGCTRILNVPQLRWKESDRLAAMTTELRRLGAEVVERQDGLEIPGVWARHSPPNNRVHVDPHGDHRIAMSLAILGLRRPGVTIASPSVVAKSYPHFWEDLERLVED